MIAYFFVNYDSAYNKIDNSGSEIYYTENGSKISVPYIIQKQKGKLTIRGEVYDWTIKPISDSLGEEVKDAYLFEHDFYIKD